MKNKTIRLNIEFKDGEELDSDEFEYTEERHKSFRECAGLLGHPDLHNVMIIVDGFETYLISTSIFKITIVIEE